MSRIGRAPIKIPDGVEVKIDGSSVFVKGPKGSLENSFEREMQILIDDGNVLVKRPSDSKRNRSLHGLTRSLNNC